MALGPNDFNLRDSDSFHKGDSFDDNIYIGFAPLRRFVTIKGFISSLSFECTKELDKKEDKNKDHTIITEYRGSFNYDVTIDMPAATLEESRNNIAIIEELQRLISRYATNTKGRSSQYRYIANKNSTPYPIFKVWFRNIISMGRVWNGYPGVSTIDFDSIDKYGLACFIDNIVYEPDMEMGFFEDDRFLFPKNIKLNLKLLYESSSDADRQLGFAISGFTANGEFSKDDFGTAPFGVIALDGKGIRTAAGNTGAFITNLREAGGQKSLEFTTESMNTTDSSVEGGQEDSYIFMSLLKKKNSKSNRYVKFKGYIESHTRDYAVDISLAESKVMNVGNAALSSAQPLTFKHLINKMKVNVPSANLNEAKKNCAKIQYLLRMFYKAHSDSNSLSTKLKQLEEEFSKAEKLSESKRDSAALRQSADKAKVSLAKGRSDAIDGVSRSIVVYSPSFIEAPDAPYSIPSTFNSMYEAGLAMNMISLNVEIDFDHGFFRDSRGRIFPKSMNIDLEFLYTKGDLIRNYYLDSFGKYHLYASPNDDYNKKEAFYPFNRKTVKLGG